MKYLTNIPIKASQRFIRLPELIWLLDFLLVMPANTDFNLVDNSFSVFTVCMLSMSSTVQCVNDFEQSTLTSNDYAISTDQP